MNHYEQPDHPPSDAHEKTRIRQLTDAAAHWEHKSEALEAELAGVRSDLAMCEAKGSSLQMRTDKADLLRVLGVADERIKALEAALRKLGYAAVEYIGKRGDGEAFTDLVQAEHEARALLPSQIGVIVHDLGSALETACEWFCYGSGHLDAVKNAGETCRVCGNERCPTENRGVKP